MTSLSPVPGPRSPIPRTLRVLMLAPTPYFADRGCHVRIYEEARALIALGHDVRIVTYHIGRDMPGIPTCRIPQVPWYRKLEAGPSWHKPYLDILLFFKAMSAARSFRPDLIHAHLHEGAFVGLFLKKLLRVPLLFDCQGSLTAEITDHGFIHPGSLLSRAFASLERRINAAADGIITSSGAGASELVERWQVPTGKVHPLMDGVDTTVFKQYPQGEVRQRLKIPGDSKLVVYLGLLNSYQGIDLLLSAVAMLKSKGSAIRFLVMGFPEEGYKKRAAELGVADMVRFAGRIDYTKAAAYLSAGDIAVSPKVSRTEANGKLFNYLACGLPVIAFDTPINREILGDTAVYAAYGDAADLAARIEGLMADIPRRQELSRASREKAENEHSWRARGEALVAIYRNLLRSRRR